MILRGVPGTNYGMAFTKQKEPSDTKFAMIDRSIAHLVRSIGRRSHTDSEFLEHMARPEQQRKLSIFRTFVCLVGATRLVIKGVPSFQPNLALANRMFEFLDNDVIVAEYNLPRAQPRKSLKREEVCTRTDSTVPPSTLTIVLRRAIASQNLKTMCVMDAVARVFLYKQAR